MQKASRFLFKFNFSIMNKRIHFAKNKCNRECFPIRNAVCVKKEHIIMKKILAAVSVAVILISALLVGCNGSDAGKVTDNSNGNPVMTTDSVIPEISSELNHGSSVLTPDGSDLNPGNSTGNGNSSSVTNHSTTV